MYYYIYENLDKIIEISSKIVSEVENASGCYIRCWNEQALEDFKSNIVFNIYI